MLRKSTPLSADNPLLALKYPFLALFCTYSGKISRGCLHRWYSMLNGTEDYTKLLSQYKYSSVNEFRTTLTDEEIKIFMGLLLHPNRICVGKAIALLEELVKEFDEIPKYLTSDNFNLIVKKLKKKTQLIIIDGIDYLSP